MSTETTKHRRMAVDGAKTRALLVEAAEALLREEGYAAITARQVAAKAGLKPQLLYYYFRTMDDLVLGVVRRVAENRLQRFEQALTAPDPLLALWELNTDPSGAALSAELTSLAGHREAIRAEIVRSATEFRLRQTEAVARLMAERGVDPAAYSPAGIVMILAALARALVTESALGLETGHAEALALVERALQLTRPKS